MAGNSKGARSLIPGNSMFTKGNITFGALDFGMNMASGDSATNAALKAGATTALWYTAPGIMGAYTAASIAPAAISAGANWHRQRVNAFHSSFARGTVGGNYQDTQRAATMRQAAVEAIQGSKLNARSALGGEARILSTGWR